MSDYIPCRQPDLETAEPCAEPGTIDVTIQLTERLTLNTLICERHYQVAVETYGNRLTVAPPRVSPDV